MAQKKITELQLRSSVTDSVNLPSDDGIQSYRVTAAQMKAYVLAAGNVGTTELATSAVTTIKMADANTTRAKLAAGGVGLDFVSGVKTSNYTVDTTTDDLVLGSVSGGAFTITLPTAVGITGRRVRIKRTDQTLATALTIATTSSQTIDGVTTRKLMTQYELIEVESDGANWHIVDRHVPSLLTSYTMVITGSSSNPTKASSPAIDQATWIRHGPDALIYYNYVGTASGSAAGTGTYYFALPTGLSCASGLTPQASTSGAQPNIGPASGFNSALATVGAYHGSVKMETTTTMSLIVGNASNHLGPMASTYCPLNSTTTSISFCVRVPIANWEG